MFYCFLFPFILFFSVGTLRDKSSSGNSSVKKSNEWMESVDQFLVFNTVLSCFVRAFSDIIPPSPSQRPTDRLQSHITFRCRHDIFQPTDLSRFILTSFNKNLKWILYWAVRWWQWLVAKNHQNPFFTLVGFCIGIIRPFWVFSFLHLFSSCHCICAAWCANRLSLFSIRIFCIVSLIFTTRRKAKLSRHPSQKKKK